jgi:GTP-sensing pleiotropic transcriptional regulator CodY
MTKLISWRDETISLLKNRPASLTTQTIADELGLTKSWVNLMAAGKIENPGVIHVQKLNEFLKAYKPN